MNETESKTNGMEEYRRPLRDIGPLGMGVVAGAYITLYWPDAANVAIVAGAIAAILSVGLVEWNPSVNT